jgi:heme-degrading monooxygenase HmoA
MYARELSIHLQPSSLSLFDEKIANEVLPLLRMQEGFHSVVTFSDLSGTHVTAISLWDTEEHAEQYSESSYSQVLEVLGPVINYTETAERGNCKVSV